MKRTRADIDSKFYKIAIGTIFLSLCAYYMGVASLYWVIVVLVLWLFHCNIKEVGFFSMLIGSGIFGRIFASEEVNIIFTVSFLLLGIIVLFKDIIHSLLTYRHSSFFMFCIILFFLVEYSLGPQNEYASEKMIKLSVRLTIWTILFLIYVETDKISNKRISIAYLILAFYYLSQSAELYGVRPTSFFDTNYFRDYCIQIGKDENQTHVVNYHTLAYLSLASTVFWTIQRGFNDKKNKLNTVLLLSISFWLIAISGTRQAIFVHIILMLLRYFLNKKSVFTIKNMFAVTTMIVSFFLIITLLGSSYFEQTLSSDSDASARLNRDTVTPFIVMAINPEWGVGFGGYSIYGNKDYPHNFFLELLCEIGIVGLFLLLLLIFLYIFTNKNKHYVRYLTYNNSYLFILFVLFFARAQVSGDLSTSVGFIAILLSFVSHRHRIIIPFIKGNEL